MTTAPQPKMRVSRRGLELIKSFEGLRRRAARLANGRFVVGYGHIRSTREGAEIGPQDAEALLRYDLLAIEAAINEWALAPLTQNQFDALVSFAFNIGLSTFRRSDVLRRINEGDLLRAAAAMDTWRRVDLDGEPVIVDALVRRRAVEKALFLTPPQGQVPAPSAVLKPLIDTDAQSSILLRRPEEIETPFDGDEALAFRSEPAFDTPFEEAASPVDGEDPFQSADQAESEPELDLVVSETTLVIPAGEDPELEPELVITETEVFIAPEATEASGEEVAELALDDQPESEDAPAVSQGEISQASIGLPPEAESDDEDEPEEELSAAQAAAAAVFARLSEILAQDREHEEEDEGDLSSLTVDPRPEGADGDFLQAPPAPPPEIESTGFAEMDEAGLASFDSEAPAASDMAFAPDAEADLAPFPEDGVLPPVIEPEEQAEFDSAYIDEDELDTGEPAVPAPAGETWDQRSGAQPTQGDPSGLTEPYEEDNRAGLLIYLGLAGMAFIIGSLVSFARTPVPGADADGSGWTFILGAVGVLCICGALWFALGPDTDDDPLQG